jgi:hypothetical protein
LELKYTSGLYWAAYKISRFVYFHYRIGESSSGLTGNTWTTVATLTESFTTLSTHDVLTNNFNAIHTNPASIASYCRFNVDGTVQIWPYSDNLKPTVSTVYVSKQ